MSRKLLYSVVAVLGIALVGGVAWWVQSRPMGASPLPSKGAVGDRSGATGSRVAGVEASPVVPVSLRDDAQAVGNLRARHSVMLRPEVLGRITALNFKDGSPVRKGQVLVQFDDQLQHAELQQMQAQLSVAQANAKRTQELVAANFMSQQAQDTAAANVQVAQAQVALSQARLSRTAVRAPFDGVVGIALVNVGDYVKDGVDLVALEDPRQVVVDYRLPERYGSKVRRGQTVEVTVDALPGQSFKGVVEAVDPVLDTNGRSLMVRAVISGAAKADQPEANRVVLRSGMFARVTTVFSINPSALVVPEEAVVPQGGKQFVIKLVAAEAGAKLPPEVKFVSQRQEVKLGVRRQGKVEIVEGLSVGDTVVVAGQQRLQKDGSPVRVVEVGRGSGKPSAAGSAAAASAAASR